MGYGAKYCWKAGGSFVDVLDYYFALAEQVLREMEAARCNMFQLCFLHGSLLGVVNIPDLGAMPFRIPN